MASKGYNGRYKSKYKNLQLRGRRWFYRRSIPAELRHRIGLTEIVRALETESLTEAERIAAELDCEIAAVIEAAQMNEHFDATALIARPCDTYLKQLIAKDRDLRRRGHYGPRSAFDVVGSVLAGQAKELDQDLDARCFGAVRDDAKALLAAEGVELSGGALDALLYQLLHTKIQAKVQTISELEGDIRLRAEEPLAPDAPATTGPEMVNGVLASDSVPVGDALKRYHEDRLSSGEWKEGRASGERLKQLQTLVV